MKKPLISVIVPSYNEEQYIEDTLESIKNQTFENFELIVSDCRSTDRTRKLAKKYADKILLVKKRSTAAARNAGAKKAEGKYLVFIDADTILPENYLAKAFKVFEKDKYIAFCGAFKFSKRTLKIIFSEKLINLIFVLLGRVNKTVIPGFNFCIPKKVFEEVNGFPDLFIEDAHLYNKLNKIGRTGYLPNFFAITSSRRIEETGVLGTFDYYCDIKKKFIKDFDFARRYNKIS